MKIAAIVLAFIVGYIANELVHVLYHLSMAHRDKQHAKFLDQVARMQAGDYKPDGKFADDSFLDDEDDDLLDDPVSGNIPVTHIQQTHKVEVKNGSSQESEESTRSEEGQANGDKIEVGSSSETPNV